MKSIEELNPHGYETTPIIDNNLEILFQRVMELQEACGMDFEINSGLRSEELQASLIHLGKSTATHSQHLIGGACDIRDDDGSLKEWAKENMNAFENIGLWLEDFKSTPTWLHCQIQSPKSGKRVFIP